MQRSFKAGARALPAVLSFAVVSAHAATSGGAEPTQLDPVVVTATGQATPLAEALAPLIVIDREQIEAAQALDLAELLRFYAGIDLGRAGGPGQQTGVFVRGGESNHTLVLVDGVRMNPSTAGGAALQNIAPEMIERVEIVKGPRASLYGSDAIGGVINVITRRDDPGLQLDGSLRGGSDDTVDASLRAHYAGERGRAGLQVQQLKTDGFPARQGFADDTGYERTSLNASGALNLGAATLGARFWDSHGNVEYYGFDPATFATVVLDQDYRNRIAAVDLSLPLTGTLAATLQGSRMRDDIEQQQSADRVETVRRSADASLVWSPAGQGQRLTAGATFTREDVEALSFGAPIDEQRDVTALRVQDEWQAGRHRAVLAATYSDYSDFGDRWDGNLDYGFDLARDTRLVAAVGTGFRAPDASDRFGFGGNPDLRPEKARNYEIGVQQQLATGQRADLRAFYSEVEDLITVNCDANFDCLAVNVDEYRNRGVEVTYELAGSDWTATLTGTLQDPVDKATDDTLLRRARRSAALRLNKRYDRFSIGTDVLASGAREDFDGRLGGYTLVNLNGGIAFTRQLALRLRVENAFDTDYRTASGYNSPGRGYYATLSFQY